jgi:hypothetical protein
VHCCNSHLHLLAIAQAAGYTPLWVALSHAPSEQTHPQNSRNTPRCSSVVLWTPCSGVEWRVFEPTIKGKRHDGQAACEPGGGGCGGIPVHPLRLHTHRTSPAQALLTILARYAEPNV